MKRSTDPGAPLPVLEYLAGAVVVAVVVGTVVGVVRAVQEGRDPWYMGSSR